MLDVAKRLQYIKCMNILKQADWKSLVAILCFIVPALFGLKLLETKAVKYSKVWNGWNNGK